MAVLDHEEWNCDRCGGEMLQLLKIRLDCTAKMKCTMCGNILGECPVCFAPTSVWVGDICQRCSELEKIHGYEPIYH